MLLASREHSHIWQCLNRQGRGTYKGRVGGKPTISYKTANHRYALGIQKVASCLIDILMSSIEYRPRAFPRKVWVAVCHSLGSGSGLTALTYIGMPAQCLHTLHRRQVIE